MKIVTFTRASFIAISLISPLLHASGFQLLEQNASGLGNAYAGTAVDTDNASTVFYNPAGISMLEGDNTFSISMNVIDLKAQFKNENSTLPFLISSGTGNGGNAGGINYIPATYITMTLSPKWRAGFGINAPFGLQTDYNANWYGRFLAIKSDIKAINYNPSLSYKISDKSAIGFGLNYQKLDATLSNYVDYSGLLAIQSSGQILAPNIEGLADIKGSNWSWGWNFGFITEMAEGTKLGFSYRSNVKHDVSGAVSFNVPITGNPVIDGALAVGVTNGPVKTSIKLPETYILSLSQQLNDRWKLLGDIAFTGWSSMQKLDIYRMDNTPLSSETLAWRDSWRIAIGTNYRYSDQIKFRTGFSYDQSPVTTKDRLARLPDTYRKRFSIGVEYKLSAAMKLDLGYSHLFIGNSLINSNGGAIAANGSIVGQYKNSADIVGFQISTIF